MHCYKSIEVYELASASRLFCESKAHLLGGVQYNFEVCG